MQNLVLPFTTLLTEIYFGKQLKSIPYLQKRYNFKRKDTKMDMIHKYNEFVVVNRNKNLFHQIILTLSYINTYFA